MVDQLNVYHKDQVPLYDLGHILLPDVKNHNNFMEILILVPVILIIYQGISDQLVNDVVIMSAIIYGLRLFTYNLTIMPSVYCYHNKSDDQNMIGGCHDCMFSGHTSLFLLLMLTLIIDYKYNALACFGVSIMYSLLIIATKAHYSIDVIIAWYITVLVFIVYKYKCGSTFIDTLLLHSSL